MFAALVAAIMSSVDSMLNSTATIFTIDIYKRLWRPASTERHLIAVGRASTAAFLVIAALWAPFLLRFERVFSYIQEFWGLITPGVAVVFLGGLFWRRATAGAALAVMVATLPVTIGVKLAMASAAFLDQMWVAGLVLLAMLVGWSVFGTQPIAAAAPPPHTPPGGEGGETVSTDIAPVVPRDWRFDALCLGVVVAVVALYAVFF
jgi:SSS family solute:Na+ symporter